MFESIHSLIPIFFSLSLSISLYFEIGQKEEKKISIKKHGHTHELNYYEWSRFWSTLALECENVKIEDTYTSTWYRMAGNPRGRSRKL
jgi:hypothetical protein